MKKIFLFFVLLVVIISFPEVKSEEVQKESVSDLATRLQRAIESAEVPQGPFSSDIVIAEQYTAKIRIFKANSDWNRPESLVWEWSAAQAPEVKKEHVTWFGHVSECKPVHGVSHLLTVASGGGVALIRLKDKKVLFYAYPGGNTHSAALLPDGNIVTASSTGNALTIFVVPDSFNGPESVKNIKVKFEDAHGLVWDKKRDILWALGGKELAGYRYEGTKENPSLKKIESILLSEGRNGGHDLYPIPGTDYLFVTVSSAIGIFEPEQKKIFWLAPIRGIKSISLSLEGVLLVLQPREQWWSPSIFYLNKNFSIAGNIQKARIYKGRWWIPNTFSE